MWPILYALGTRFSRYLVLPIAGVIGAVGFYVERKFVPQRPPIEYLGSSIQDQRAKRHVESTNIDVKDVASANSLNILQPREN